MKDLCRNILITYLDSPKEVFAQTLDGLSYDELMDVFTEFEDLTRKIENESSRKFVMEEIAKSVA